MVSDKGRKLSGKRGREGVMNGSGERIQGTGRSFCHATLVGAVLASFVCASAMTASSAAAQTPQAGQRIVLVTGSTSGLGREVARRLAATGAHVIVHGRDRE